MVLYWIFIALVSLVGFWALPFLIPGAPLAFNQLIFLIPVIIFWKPLQLTQKLFKKNRFKTVIFWLFISVGMVGSLNLLLSLAFAFLKTKPVFSLEELLKLTGGSKILLGLQVGLLTPFIEEFFFRGFLQTSFASSLKPRGAIAASAFFFSIAHLNLFLFLPYFLFGLALGFLFHKSQNILFTVLAHGLNNMLALALILHQGFSK